MDPVAICNLALGFIGEKRITSLEDDSASAELCATLYPEAIRTALEARAWLFATGSVDLGSASASNDEALPVKFALPTEVVRAVRCDDGSGEWRLKWERRGAEIFTEDTETAYVLAVKYTEDVDRFTPTFCRAVARLIASDLAYGLKENERLGDKQYALYEREIDLAGALDGMQGSSQNMGVRNSAATRR